MNEAQFQRVKAAAKAQHAKGVVIMQGGYFVSKDFGGKWQSTLTGSPSCAPCACPLGCLLIEENPPSSELAPALVAALWPKTAESMPALQTSSGVWRPFTCAFDQTGPDQESLLGINDPWYVAGERMRLELKAEGVMS